MPQDQFDINGFLAGTPPPPTAAQRQAGPATAPASGAFDIDSFLANPQSIGNSAALAPPQPNKYQQAAIAERDNLVAKGVPLPEGYARRLTDAPFLGWGDEAAAAMTTPLEMIKRGVNPIEGYRYGKAREDLSRKAAERNTGYTGDALEVLGGLAMLPGQFIASPLSTIAGGAAKGIKGVAGRMFGFGADAAAQGAVSGAGNAESIADIPAEAGRGALISGAIGAPFGAAANVARRTTAKVPTEDELNRAGKAAYTIRDTLPVAYNTERAVVQPADRITQANRQTYGIDTPLTNNKLQSVADQGRADIAAATGRGEAVIRPREVAGLRRDIYDEGSGKVFANPITGERVVPSVPTGSKTDELAAVRASRAIGDVLTNPDPRLLSLGTKMRDAIAAAAMDTRGRSDFGAAFRSKAVTDTIADALRSPGNTPFSQRFQTGVTNATKSGEFDRLSQDEKEQLAKLTKKANIGNVINEIGQAMGKAGVFGAGGAAVAYGTGQADPSTAIAAGVGSLLGGKIVRGVGERYATGKAEKFAEKLRERSQLYRDRVAISPTEAGPGLTVRGPHGEVMPSAFGAMRQALTTGDQGAIRDALARILLKHTTGDRDAP